MRKKCSIQIYYFSLNHTILTKINQHIFSFQTKNYAVIKQHIYYKNLYAVVVIFK